jgi:hypothetical protein
LKLNIVLAGLAAAALAACGADVKYDAARDIHAFLTAVQNGDSAGFERHIDRPALRASMVAEAREALERQGAGALGPALGGGLAEAAVDRMITPEGFKFAAEQGGMSRTPSAPEIATQLRVVGAGRVCLAAPQGGCALNFEEKGDVWKLVSIDASAMTVAPGLPGGGAMQRDWPGRS